MLESTKKYILAIDHGTSGPKTAIISTNGEVIDWVFKEVPLHLLEGGGAEQDPADWWNAFMEGAKELIDKKKVPVEDIIGICNTSQWSGTLPVDTDGNPLMNCIIWMDTRGAELTNKTFRGIVNVSGYGLTKILSWIKRTGGGPSLSGKDSLSHILWLKEEKPEIYNKTHLFLEPQDYINYKLTGKFAASYASIHLHWVTDIRDKDNIKYSKKLLKRVKIDRKKLPDLKGSQDVLGTITEEVASKLGLIKDTKVVMGAPDLQSAAIGSGAVNNYEGHICIGTSDWILCHVSKKHTDIANNLGTLPSGIDGKFIYGNEQEIAGGTLTFLRDNILYHTDLLLMDQYKDQLDEVFSKLIKEISEMEDISENDLGFVKKRLLNYEDELLHNKDLTDVYKGLAQIGKDLAKEYKIKGETLEYLKTQFIKYKNEVLRDSPLKNVYKIFDKLADKAPAGSNKLIFTPWLYGERAPIADETVRGGFYNVSLDMTRGDLIRAILEGVAYNVRWLLEFIEKYVKKSMIKENSDLKKKKIFMPELALIGGGAQSDVWCQIFADVLDRKIKRVNEPIQANARGAAFMGAVGLGHLTWEEVPGLIEYSKVFTPNQENRNIYDKLFEEFKNIYSITKKMYKRLNSN